MSSIFFAKLRRDYLRAADLYYQQGRLDKAVEMYTLGGHLQQAARLSVEMGDVDRAVGLFVRAGDRRQAGDLLATNGRPKDAIPHFEASGAFWPAAEAALAIGQPTRAARFYERAGAWASASRCYEKAGQMEDATRVMELEVKRVAGAVPRDTEAWRTAALRRADLLGRTGRFSDAAEAYLAAGQPGRAAPLFERAGQLTPAIQAYSAADEHEAAARLLGLAPDFDQSLAAEIWLRSGRSRQAAEILAGSGRAAEAAEAFERAGEPLAAAYQWELAHEPARAAEAFHGANRPLDAARCHVAAGNLGAAAEAYSGAGQPIEAATLFERLGQFLRAAQGYLEAGDRTAAVGALQSLQPGTQGFERATLVLVPMLLEDGLAEAALHRLQMLGSESRLTTTGTLDRVYWEARVLEALGRGEDAATMYERLLSLRRDHRDAENRLALLRTGPRRPETPPPPGVDTQPLVLSEVAFSSGALLAGRYEILGELGRGGMSRVYRARDRELGEMVAIKTLLRRSSDSTDEERLLREVQICRRITHPNVVRVYDIGRVPGGVFVTMELLEGLRLDRLIQEAGQLPLERVRSILVEIASGLAEAHSLDIVHRDLKPGNIILTPTRLKILDFGIARMGETDVRLTQTGEAMGSPLYMSPEQVQGAALDARSDLYALGVLAFTLLNGREPFTGATATVVALHHLQTPPPDPALQRPGLPVAWGSLVLRLLAKDPGDRPDSAEAVLAELAALPEA